MPINVWIANALEEYRPQLEQAKAIVEYQPGSNAAFLSADPASLNNALVNLLDNALKYNTNPPRISIAFSIGAGFAEISISDNGIGIPEVYHRMIFDQFFRVPQGNLHDVKGFGLGLSYVKEVIKQHGGEIVVRDNEPSGSIFMIKLPLS